MSGRGRGRSRSNGVRGRGRNDNNNSGRRGSRRSNIIMKYLPHATGKQQSATYDVVTEDILQLIQKEYKDGADVADSLRNMEELDFRSQSMTPKLLVSNKLNQQEKELEQRTFDNLLDKEMAVYAKRKANYEGNMKRAYTLIYTRCGRSIQHRIEALPDFEKEIRNKPIKLLKAIKVIMHDPERAKYPYASLTLFLQIVPFWHYMIPGYHIVPKWHYLQKEG